MDRNAAGRRAARGAETRSIEFVPHDERYGAPWRLFTLWCSSNLQISALVVGCLGVAAGLSLAWSCLAIGIGVLVGSIFMAAHSAQGPHLGIPQMIQSRAQFGVFGAGLPLLIYVLANVLFSAANAIMMRDAINHLIPIGGIGAIVLFGVVSLLISYYGYEAIHRLGVYLTVGSGAVFLLALWLTVASGGIGGASWQLGVFKPAIFMLMITQAASWTLGYGPYVADYSRYLPSDVRTGTTFWFTYLGNILGAGFIMLLGAILAAVFPGNLADMSLTTARLFGPFATVALGVLVLGMLQINVLNIYSGFMSGVTVFTGFSGSVSLTRRTRFGVMFAVAAAATLTAILTQDRFNDFFSDTLIAQVYLIVPWSAINLVDYYWVRKGEYSVADIYDARGVYGSYNWRTLGIYGVAVAAQVPFMDLSFYHGAIAQRIGADMAWIPALVIPACLYAALTPRRPVIRTRESLLSPP
jgi:NCS1 family nucleobase:cation symporter-1